VEDRENRVQFQAPFKPATGPTQSHIQRVPGTLSSWVKRPGPKADYSPPFRDDVKNAWSYTFTPPCGTLLS
jgi:hypothetical protein